MSQGQEKQSQVRRRMLLTRAHVVFISVAAWVRGDRRCARRAWMGAECRGDAKPGTPEQCLGRPLGASWVRQAEGSLSAGLEGKRFRNIQCGPEVGEEVGRVDRA